MRINAYCDEMEIYNPSPSIFGYVPLWVSFQTIIGDAKRRIQTKIKKYDKTYKVQILDHVTWPLITRITNIKASQHHNKNIIELCSISDNSNSSLHGFIQLPSTTSTYCGLLTHYMRKTRTCR
jgi:hypothetical protein